MLLLNETQKKLEQLLVERNLIDSVKLEQLKLESANTGKSFVSLLDEHKVVKDEEQLTKAIADASDIPYANAQKFSPNEDILKLIPRELAESYRIVPLGNTDNRVAVGMIDPANVQAIDFVSRKIGKPIAAFMVSGASVDHILKQYNVSDQVSEVIDALSQERTEAEIDYEKAHSQPKAKNIETLVQDAPITRALKTIMDYAAESKASDIHIEPHEDSLKLRFRVDGVLKEVMSLPKTVEPALVSRIKILSNLKIDEHRIPQDGEFRVNFDGRDIDLRVAVAPVVHGEQVVIRLLDKDKSLLSFEKLGFKGKALADMNEAITKANGMMLSTGPTGSGKSTTLYTIITTIMDESINIVTLEDPVEYKIDGVNQIQINSGIGLTFSSGLRSILRQDPDVVMVGEIRDQETADLAVQAALTGHVVLSTLHTNSAAGLLPRLLDMEIEPFLIASTVNVAIGQRLVRKNCDKCKKPYQSTESETESVKKALLGVLPADAKKQKEAEKWLGYKDLPLASEKAYTLFKGEGCDECQDGYKGRMGIYEVLPMSEGIEKLLLEHATSGQIQEFAQKEGMVTMKQDGYLKALAGLTTLEEVVRVATDG